MGRYWAIAFGPASTVCQFGQGLKAIKNGQGEAMQERVLPASTDMCVHVDGVQNGVMCALGHWVGHLL